MGLLDRDSRGYALSIDLLLALIPLTILLGVVAADMDNMFYQMEDTLFRGSNERVAADTLDTLIETSGDPYNWEQSNATPKVVGLARYDLSKQMPVQNVLSPYKVGAVKSSQIQNLLGNEYGFYFRISSLKTGSNIRNISSTPTITTVDGITAKDVVRIERLVLYSPFEIVSEGTNLRDNGQSLPISTPPNSFMTNVAYNDAFDYWVYLESVGPTTVTSGWVKINDNIVVPQNEFRAGTILVVNKIDPAYLKNQTDLQPNSVVLMIHGSPTDKFNMYVIQVPKGTPKELVDPEAGNRQRCKVEFYLWLR